MKIEFLKENCIIRSESGWMSSMWCVTWKHFFLIARRRRNKMSWLKPLGRFQWTEGIKNTACRYLLQRYLGQFLEEKLTLDQLTVNLCNGTGSVTNVKLDVQVFTIFSLFHYYQLPSHVDNALTRILFSTLIFQT